MLEAMARIASLQPNEATSQVNTLTIAKSQARRKQKKGMHKFSSVYSERGVLLPVLTSGGK
jgi:hypothetical protein